MGLASKLVELAVQKITHGRGNQLCCDCCQNKIKCGTTFACSCLKLLFRVCVCDFGSMRVVGSVNPCTSLRCWIGLRRRRAKLRDIECATSAVISLFLRV